LCLQPQRSAGTNLAGIDKLIMLKALYDSMF
jgi:hypothetical protein